MKGNPVSIIVTHLKPFTFASFHLPKAMAYPSDDQQDSRLGNRGFESKNE
jgi:hypothetical protein